MFSHPVQYNNELRVAYHEFAERHFLKSFKKKYRGRTWILTEEAFIRKLARIGIVGDAIQSSQQIDELWKEENRWVFKYDFRVFGTKVSSKTAGNRIVGVLDLDNGEIEIFLIYHKSDLPKNTAETEYIKSVYMDLYN